MFWNSGIQELRELSVTLHSAWSQLRLLLNDIFCRSTHCLQLYCGFELAADLSLKLSCDIATQQSDHVQVLNHANCLPGFNSFMQLHEEAAVTTLYNTVYVDTMFAGQKQQLLNLPPHTVRPALHSLACQAQPTFHNCNLST